MKKRYAIGWTFCIAFSIFHLLVASHILANVSLWLTRFEPAPLLLSKNQRRWSSQMRVENSTPATPATTSTIMANQS